MSDIEAFLRRAAERRGQVKRPPIEIMELVEAEIVDAEPVGVGSHVASHLDTSGFTERASHLGERAGLADDDMDAHLHAKFDHRLGSLGLQPSQVELVEAQTSVDTGSDRASDLLQLFRSPRHLQQAIILSEILQRPTDRW
jgi:hypothetical protein